MDKEREKRKIAEYTQEYISMGKYLLGEDAAKYQDARIIKWLAWITDKYNDWIRKRHAMAEEAAQRFSHRGTGVRGHSAAAAAAAALSTSAPEPRASAAAASALRTSEPAARASAPVSRASAPAAVRVSDRGRGVRGYSAPVRRVFIGQANELSRLIESEKTKVAAPAPEVPPRKPAARSSTPTARATGGSATRPIRSTRTT